MSETSRPASWSITLAGALYFLVAGLQLISGEIPITWDIHLWLRSIDTLLLDGLLVPAIGLAAGWALRFPRWSYPYAGALPVYSLVLMSTVTPLLRQLGLLNRGWGWYAWLPFLLALATGLLFTRSLRPFVLFFSNIRRDWTLGTYAMFGWMPIIISIAFDEIDHLYSLIFMLFLTALMVVTSMFYLRARRHVTASIILGIGLLLTITLTEAAMIAYWQPVGGVFIPGAIAWGMVILGVLLSPYLLSLGLQSRGERSAQS